MFIPRRDRQPEPELDYSCDSDDFEGEFGLLVRDRHQSGQNTAQHLLFEDFDPNSEPCTNPQDQSLPSPDFRALNDLLRRECFPPQQ